MYTRLLSFLSDFEGALQADDPTPSDGSWDTSRTVNFHLGLARLRVGVRLASGQLEPRGVILLQSYKLADDSPCLKVALSWNGTEIQSLRSIYAKPDLNWKSEARKVAAEWMAGPPAAAATGTQEHPAPLAASLATG